MRKAHNKNINNLFDFQAEDNIGNVSNNEKLNVLPATLGDGRAKRKDSISIPILKSNGVEITDPKLKEEVVIKMHRTPGSGSLERRRKVG